MSRTFVKRACWAATAIGFTVFVLLMLNLVQPTQWTGIAVILAFPAFIIVGILTTNDFLRTRGFGEAEIPTSRRNLSRSVTTGWLLGLGFALVAGLVLHFALQ